MGSFAGLSSLENLSSFEDIVLTLAMGSGRLELRSVLALLHPSVWRDTRFVPRPSG